MAAFEDPPNEQNSKSEPWKRNSNCPRKKKWSHGWTYSVHGFDLVAGVGFTGNQCGKEMMASPLTKC